MHRLEAFQWAKDRVKIGYFADQGFDISGVVHVGANDGYEIQFYLAMGINRIIAFEPLPSAYQLLRDSYGACGVMCIPIALGNKKQVRDFYVTSGDGKGSSLLVPTPDANYPEIKETKVFVDRYDHWVRSSLLLENMEDYDCLVVDVQGMEYEVLEGFGSYLDGFNFLNIECSRVPIYEGEKIADEVIAFLDEKGFQQMTPTCDHDDIMFIKKECL